MARFGLATVRGRSMLPTLVDGDRLLVRYGAVPSPGDLVVVRLPADSSGEPRPLAVKRAARAEPDGWWVERDNPAEGVDSWSVGVVRHRDLVAVVVARAWPVWRKGSRRRVPH
jgi:signal peptidase I